MRRLLFLPLVSMFFTSFSFIYDFKVLSRINRRTGKEQFFIGCSDYHDKKHPLTSAQVSKIDQKLALCDSHTTDVYIEDLSSRGDDGKGGCGRFVVNSQGGILGGLTGKCQALGLSFYNVEYRFCRVASISPVLNNLNSDLFSFPSVVDTRVVDLVAEVEDVMREVRGYNDGQHLNNYYAQSLKEINEQMGQLGLIKHGNMSVAQFLDTHVMPNERLGMLRVLLTFDSVLLDLKLVHRIANSDKSSVAFTGGSHIDRVGAVLEDLLDFRAAQPSRKQLTREYNPQKCIGSTMVNGKYCVKPEAVGVGDFDLAFAPLINGR